MKFRHMLLAGVCALALPATASAQSQSTISEGFYLGGQAGGSWLNHPTLDGPVTNEVDFEVDWTLLVEGGYRLSNGLRFGLELSTTDHTVDGIAGGNATRVGSQGDIEAFTTMVIAAYEFDTGSAIRPYLSIGAGWVNVDYDGVGPVFTANQFVEEKDSAWAVQGGAGLIYSFTPNLEASLNYRFVDSNALEYTTTTGAIFEEDYQNHSVLVGLRYVFAAAAPAPEKPEPKVEPKVEPKPEVKEVPKQEPAAISRNFTVFFDWDSAELTADARQVLADVVANARQGGITTIEVIGHADTSGPAGYNQRLSERRAAAVRAFLEGNGLGSADIAVQGRGETELLVPTPDGVREPSNRRGVIIFPQ